MEQNSATSDSWDIRGKTCMITGATSGIGRVTAIELSAGGARTVLICRNRERAEELVREIRAKTPGAEVTVMIADLASQAEIRRVAAEFLATNSPLHVLINNAGVFNLGRRETVDGIEETFAVNHLAYFLLTMLLLERIKQSAPARIINISSTLHQRTSMNFDDLGGKRSYGGMRAYGQSKLGNILFTNELARRLAGTGVIVNSVHPGGVATNLGRNNGVLARGFIAMAGLFSHTPEKGAETQVYLASAPEVEGVTGEYFVDCKPARSSAESRDQRIAHRLWEVSAQMTGIAAG